jgi:hypothetical protein
MVSVDENNHNEIIWDDLGLAASYNIYREEMGTGNYEWIASVEDNSQNICVDWKSDARIRSYSYKVAGMDTCGSESLLCSAHKTMHLTINAGINNAWNLIWTAYEGVNYATVNIYRTTGDTLITMEKIATLPSQNTTYTDLYAPEGYVYYRIEISMAA